MALLGKQTQDSRNIFSTRKLTKRKFGRYVETEQTDPFSERRPLNVRVFETKLPVGEEFEVGIPLGTTKYGCGSDFG